MIILDAGPALSDISLIDRISFVRDELADNVVISAVIAMLIAETWRHIMITTQWLENLVKRNISNYEERVRAEGLDQARRRPRPAATRPRPDSLPPRRKHPKRHRAQAARQPPPRKPPRLPMITTQWLENLVKRNISRKKESAPKAVRPGPPTAPRASDQGRDQILSLLDENTRKDIERKLRDNHHPENRRDSP